MQTPKLNTVFYVYVSIGGENRVAVYQMNAETGDLEKRSSTDVGGAVGAICPSPDQKHLYAAIRSTKSVASLSINSKTGELELVTSTPVFDNPVYLFTDNMGRFLLCSSYGGGKAAVYPIDPTGAVKSEPTCLFETRKNPHSIMLDPSNRFGFVPNTGADCILQYVWDGKTGRLIPNEVPLVQTAADTGPRHFTFYPERSFVYFVNEKGNNVYAFALDEATGRLRELQLIATLPEGYKETSHTADIHITPDRKFLYASNRGHDSLAGYSVDAKTGRLTGLGYFPTEKSPREFAIDPTGNFVYAAGQSNGRMASYRIDRVTGILKPLNVYEVGEGPAWVLVLAFGK